MGTTPARQEGHFHRTFQYASPRQGSRPRADRRRRSLHHRPGAGSGRDGRGLSGPRPQARPPRRDQDPAPGDRRRRSRPALPAGDPDPGPAPAPPHPPPARFRHHRRGVAPSVLRHALRGRRDPPPAPHPRGAAPRGGSDTPGARDRRSAPLRPRGRADSSRREARERPALPRPRPGGGLRHRAGRGRRGRRPADPAGAEHGDPHLHESRAGPGRKRGRCPGRPIQPRLRSL